jgi:hypothetical protein
MATPMTPPTAGAGSTDRDEQPIAMAAWLAADLLRLLEQLRGAQPAALRTAIRDDLDYHAGLLRIRLRHTTRPHDEDHP